MEARNEMLDVMLIDFAPRVWSRGWRRSLHCRVEDGAFVFVTKQVPHFLGFITQSVPLVIGQSWLLRVGGN